MNRLIKKFKVYIKQLKRLYKSTAKNYDGKSIPISIFSNILKISYLNHTKENEIIKDSIDKWNELLNELGKTVINHHKKAGYKSINITYIEMAIDAIKDGFIEGLKISIKNKKNASTSS